MKNTILGLLLAGAFSATAQGSTDNFNRSALGSDWITQSGTFSLDGTTVGGHKQSLMTFTPGDGATSASLEVSFDGTGIEYGAIVLGYAGIDKNAFIKVQSQNGHGTLESAAFYYGNNSEGYFFCLPSEFNQFSSAQITGTLNGSVATLTINAGNISQSFTWDYGTATFGSGVGVGVYGAARLDNFATPAVPEPETNAMLLAGLGLVGFMAHRRKNPAL